MLHLTKCAAVLVAIVPLALVAGADEIDRSAPVTSRTTEKPAPRIDLALLLDTSNSMDGLINQARAQLWKIVNELATAEKDGKAPELRVALYEYGNDSLPSEGGYIRRVLAFTDDLDKVSEELFALTTNGGQEYCGQVIEAATSGLNWSANDDDLKMIVIAGNEPFSQGPVDYREACRKAIERGIVVNTIFCGDRLEGIQTGWEEGATLADGTYSHIDQNKQVAEIATPFDAELARLSGELNRTFLFFGRPERRRGLARNQAVQDSNAAQLGIGVLAERAAAKGGRAYRFEADLVDRFAHDAELLGELKDDELPEELKGKSVNEQKALLRQKASERESLQKTIAELTEKRKAFLAEQRKNQVATGQQDQSLDEALLSALRKHAEKKKFAFKE